MTLKTTNIKTIKRIARCLLLTALLLAALTGCGRETDFSAQREITVVSREDGSGTRGAFTELFGVYTLNAAGGHSDATTEEAIITNNTAVMMYSVMTNPYAIGYISLGSLNSEVKPVAVDGVYASVAAIESGDYKATRPFNIVTGSAPSEAAADFIAFIFSSEGRAVIEATGYVPAGDGGGAYHAAVNGGKVVIGGSSSVTPVMEKLKEAYAGYNSGVIVEIQQSDSTTGISSTQQGICDIGMSSRELTADEAASALTVHTIVLDGIVIIINLDNPLEGLTASQVGDIFRGSTLYWQEVITEAAGE